MSWMTLKDKIVKVRKLQYCFGCRRLVEPGGFARYWFSVDERSGDACSVYLCMSCEGHNILYPEVFDDSEEGLDDGFILDDVRDKSYDFALKLLGIPYFGKHSDEHVEAINGVRCRWEEEHFVQTEYHAKAHHDKL